jgi:hypothetical protein
VIKVSWSEPEMTDTERMFGFYAIDCNTMTTEDCYMSNPIRYGGFPSSIEEAVEWYHDILWQI